MYGHDDNEEDIIGFPIQDMDINVHMKNISPFFLPNFHGMRIEDPEKFLFEFEILCRSYGYLSHTKKLRLFLATLKDKALKWLIQSPKQSR